MDDGSAFYIFVNSTIGLDTKTTMSKHVMSKKNLRNEKWDLISPRLHHNMSRGSEALLTRIICSVFS